MRRLCILWPLSPKAAFSLQFLRRVPQQRWISHRPWSSMSLGIVRNYHKWSEYVCQDLWGKSRWKPTSCIHERWNSGLAFTALPVLSIQTFDKKIFNYWKEISLCLLKANSCEDEVSLFVKVFPFKTITCLSEAVAYLKRAYFQQHRCYWRFGSTHHRWGLSYSPYRGKIDDK